MSELRNTLLLVEDDPLLSMSETHWLKKAGYDVIQAANGENAIRIIAEKLNKIDLILMDINLGNGIDGTQAAHEILKENDIPLLFLSSHTEKEIVEKTEKITSYGYVVKDSQDVVLLASIKMAFKLHEANKNLRVKEKALEESQERLRRAELVAKTGNWEFHLDSGIVIGSEGANRIYGLSLKEHNIEEVRKLPLPEYRQRMDEALSRLVENGEQYDVEYKIQKADSGEVIDVRSIAQYDKTKRIIFGTIQDISKQKHEEEILKLSEEKYRLLLGLAPDAFFQGDQKGNFITTNDRAAELTGYTKEELLTMNMKDFFSEKTLGYAPLRYDLLLKGKTIRTERELTRKNGEKLTIEMHSKLMPDGTYQSFIRDVSSRKRAEKTLETSEKKYRDLFEKSDDAILIINNGKFVDCNQATVNMLCYVNKEELLNTHPSQLSPMFQPDGKPSFEKADEMMRIALEKGSHRFGWNHKKATGQIFPVEVLLTAIHTDDDHQVLYTVWRDVTEQMDAATALRESELKYRSILEKIPDGVYKSTHEGKFLEVNPAMVKMLGYESREDLLAIDIKSELYFKVEDRESAALEEKLEEMAVFRLRKKDGSEIWVEDHGRHVLDQDGNVLYHEGIMRDVTERTQTALQIQKYTEELKTANAAKDKFFSIIAHDLKNPFHAITSALKLVLSDEESLSPEEKRKFLQSVLNTSEKTYLLLDNLLLWSRHQMGKVEFIPEEFDLSEIISRNVELLRNNALVKKISLTCEIEKGIKVNADINMIDTVVRNLISNAIKFTRENGSVSINSQRLDDSVEIYICDNGIGIENERRDMLFKIDQTISTRGTKEEVGSGLGLIICKEFIEKNSGEIKVESETGQGSKFSFRIPYRQVNS